MSKLKPGHVTCKELQKTNARFSVFTQPAWTDFSLPSFNFIFEGADTINSIYKDKNNNRFKNKLVKAFRNMYFQYYIDMHKISQYNLI